MNKPDAVECPSCAGHGTYEDGAACRLCKGSGRYVGKPKKGADNTELMTMNEQLATRKLLEDIEHALTLSTSFSVKLNIERLMKDYRKEWSK